MIRAVVNKPFTDDKNYVELFGLNDDNKPTTGIITGSKFTEVDTGDVYLFAEGDSPTWTKVAAGWVDPEETPAGDA